ncbi:hypothetical protein K6V92_06385 [Cupriavidus respiraculi]|uniref:hypothetical protein n=1 Tax=Cupriavidus respiraculi TaxID=195930 RepID=UPI001C9523AD|nr:hypothetical protein [Cupriavidus respiraculi]MBY4946248.1 hypothetical protein [Cupriavidus respiraculi]
MFAIAPAPRGASTPHSTPSMPDPVSGAPAGTPADALPETAPAPSPVLALDALPTEVLAHIVGYLPPDARHALVRAGRQMHEHVSREVRRSRLAERIARATTLSTLRDAMRDVAHPLLSDEHRARSLEQLAARLPSVQPRAAAAAVLLAGIGRLPLTLRAEPLIRLMQGMSLNGTLDAWEGLRDRIADAIRALPPALQTGPLGVYLDLMPVGELDPVAAVAWTEHTLVLPERGRGGLLASLVASRSAFEGPAPAETDARLLSIVAALPSAERVPVLCALAAHFGRLMQRAVGVSGQGGEGGEGGESGDQTLPRWLAVLEAAERLPVEGETLVLAQLAGELGRHAAAGDTCWDRLWNSGGARTRSPEQAATWLAKLARHASAETIREERWTRVLTGIEGLPPACQAAPLRGLARSLRAVPADDACNARWASLLQRAPALPSLARARLLQMLATVLVARQSANDDDRWTALGACAQTLAPREQALLLVEFMSDAVAAEGLWGSHLRTYPSLSDGQRAEALAALAFRLRLLPYPGRRTVACNGMLRAIAALPLPLQLAPGLALARAGAAVHLAAHDPGSARGMGAMLARWPSAQRLQWLQAAASAVDDVHAALWLVDCLEAVPAWMRAGPLAVLANWGAHYARCSADLARGLWIGLVVAGGAVPARHRAPMLPAMQELLARLKDTLGAHGRRDLRGLLEGVPDCDRPVDAEDDEDGHRGGDGKRARLA